MGRFQMDGQPGPSEPVRSKTSPHHDRQQQDACHSEPQRGDVVWVETRRNGQPRDDAQIGW